MSLKKTGRDIVKLIYQMMYDVSKIFEKNELEYWAVGGTFLGAVRHKGLIPWDDDIDLGILQQDMTRFLKLKPELKKYGYSVVKVWFGYKIFYTDRPLLKGFKYSFPDIDIFPYKKVGQTYIPSLKAARDAWPKEMFKETELYPLKIYKFGEVDILGPNKHKEYFTRIYDKNWNTIAYRQYDHEREKEVEKVKTRLTKKDRSPAQPTKVIKTRVTKKTSRKSRSAKKTSRKSRAAKKTSRKSRSAKKTSRATKKTSRKSRSAKKTSRKSRSAKKINNKSNRLQIPVYVINCNKSSQRYKSFTSHTKKAGLKVTHEQCVNGRNLSEDTMCDMVSDGLVAKNADMTPVEVAISFSHFSVWNKFIDSREPYAMVLEDDVKVNKDFVDSIIDILNNVPEFSILYLFNGDWMKTKKKKLNTNSNFDIYQEVESYNAGGVAYIISREFAQYAINRFFPVKHPQDIYLGSLYRKGKHLTVKMTRKYKSPLLNVSVEPEHSTQTYDADAVKDYRC